MDITDELINMYENDLNNEGITLVKFVAEKYCNFNQIELGFIDKFWNNAFNNEWIYLSKDMIINDFGYADYKNTIGHFYNRVLICNFIINEDYREVNLDYIKEIHNKSNELFISRGINRKYYEISNDCYKELLMLIKTDKVITFRKYYIKIEKLSKKIHNILTLLHKIKIDNLNKEFDEKLIIEKDKQMILSNLLEKQKENMDNMSNKNSFSIETDEIIINKLGIITKIDISSISQIQIDKFVNKLKNYTKKNQIIVESYDLTSYFKQFIIQTIENIYNRIKSLF
jgi:phage anti-repressor protein